MCSLAVAAAVVLRNKAAVYLWELAATASGEVKGGTVPKGIALRALRNVCGCGKVLLFSRVWKSGRNR